MNFGIIIAYAKFIKIKQDFHGMSPGVATSSPGLARQELARNATGENSFNPKHVVLQENEQWKKAHQWEVKGTHPPLPYFFPGNYGPY